MFTNPFPNPEEIKNERGQTPVIFDVIDSDGETLLPEGLKLVLKINPTSLSVKYTKIINRIQTRGGFVEQHWGDAEQSIDLEMTTAHFMRVYVGTISSTDPTKTGISRRDTLGYDSYLDMLSLFHNNGSVYDAFGNIVLQGKIKLIYDGGVYTGWFSSFNVEEVAETPYTFKMSASFIVEDEVQSWRTI
tara:strand:+ start:280 stop:846 length:567 start_codon:yes stop_codon:yes gene_type:complete